MYAFVKICLKKNQEILELRKNAGNFKNKLRNLGILMEGDLQENPKVTMC